jgi:hypothetical protein
MQRKQQVGECWVCVIFFACVCVGVSNSTTAADDPSSSDHRVVCTECFPRGPQGRGEVRAPPPPIYMQNLASGISPGPTRFGAEPQNLFFGRFLLFLADFCYF